MNEQVPNKIKHVVCIILISAFIALLSIGVLTGSFSRVTLLQTTIPSSGTTEIIESGEEVTRSDVLSKHSNGGQDQGSKDVHQEQVQPILRPELVHDVDCSKIKMHNDVATKWAKYACSLHPNSIMLASFNQESGYNPYARGDAGERGICQLLPQYNKIVYDKRREEDIYRQLDFCVSKRLSVKSQKQIWASYNGGEYKKYLYYFTR